MKIAFLEENIVTALIAASHEGVHFVSGRSCLKAISSSHFDVCILDWEVPDMSSTEVLVSLKLKSNYPPFF